MDDFNGYTIRRFLRDSIFIWTLYISIQQHVIIIRVLEYLNSFQILVSGGTVRINQMIIVILRLN